MFRETTSYGAAFVLDLKASFSLQGESFQHASSCLLLDSFLGGMHREHGRAVDSCLFVSSLSSLASFCPCGSCGTCKHFHIFFCGACGCRKCRPSPSFLVLQAPPWPSLQVAHLVASSRKDISDMGALTFSDCFSSLSEPFWTFRPGAADLLQA